MTAADTHDNRRFDAGDGLRAIAALLVLVHHAARQSGLRFDAQAPFLGPFGDVPGHVFRGLDVGLYIFFALSGYLLARPFARALVHARPLPSTRRYAWARLLRIVPAFWVVWTLTILIDGTRGASAGDILAVYGFAQVYHTSEAAGLMVQAWTLDIEMAFYLFLPVAGLALWSVMRRLPETGAARAWFLLGAVAAAAAASLAIRAAWENPAWLSKPPEYLVAFTPGIVLAVVEQRWAARLRGAVTAARAAWVLAGLAAVVTAWRCWAPDDAGALQTLLGTLAGGLLVAGALLREWTGAPAWRGLVHAVPRWLGERSYGIYLIHLLILRQIVDPVVDRISTPEVAVVVLVVLLAALSAAAAGLLWRLVEKPALDLRRRPRATPAPAPA